VQVLQRLLGLLRVHSFASSCAQNCRSFLICCRM
jgi:hypothetical protein